SKERIHSGDRTRGFSFAGRTPFPSLTMVIMTMVDHSTIPWSTMDKYHGRPWLTMDKDRGAI
ncbi:hypothetical protein DPMN_064166, partial [Dreissena polymorpha]